MKSRNIRVTTALVTFGLFVALAGLIAPSALGATAELRFVDPDGSVTGQPQDAKVNQTIRTGDLNVGSGFVQVEVVDAVTKARITNFNKPIGFVLNAADGFATGNVLDVTPRVPVNGVATFSAGLSIDTENEPQFTDYSLIPVTTRGPFVTGLPSEGFDVWEDGESCTGGTDTCDASLRGGFDKYKLSAAGTLGASELTSGELPGLVCAGQKTIFANSVFSYATTGSNTPVFLENHITRADWRASANNGQAHADWCIGLLDPWTAQGGPAVLMSTDGVGGNYLYVGLAPKCPSQNPSGSAPCIVSQTGDGKGGSISIGWLPAGDPPRRT